MTLTEVILTILEEGTQTSADLFVAFVNLVESGTIINLYRRQARHELRSSPIIHFVDSRRERQKFLSLLNKLKRQGFIKKQTLKQSMFWKIAGQGLRKLKKIRAEDAFSRHRNETDDILRIIAFDVPEKEREKRTWLRSVLLLMGFSMVQQSVWIGRKKIPEEFFDALRRKKMLKYIHVFSVGETGTLKIINV
jgi:hypothetical protein